MTKEYQEKIQQECAKVYKYNHKHKMGFTNNEINDLLSKCKLPIRMDKFWDAMMGNTGVINDEGQFINYDCDVLVALKCGLEFRDLTDYEWD